MMEWITAVRVRRWGIAGAVVFAALFIFLRVTAVNGLDRFGNPLFPDFAALHAAGELAGRGDWDLVYRQDVISGLADARLQRPGQDGSYLYLYPPYVTWLLIPAGWVAYPVAAWGFFGLNAILAWWLARRVAVLLAPSLDAAAVGWVFLASVPLWRTLLFGQSGLWLLAAGVLFYARWRERREGEAGLWLAVGWLKPQLFFGLFLWVILTGSMRLRIGWGMGTLFWLGLGCLPGGASGWEHWWQTVQQLRQGGENPLWRHSIMNALELEMGKNPGEGGKFFQQIVWTLGITLLLGGLWKARERPDGEDTKKRIGMAFALLGGVLWTPRIYQYDLILLYPLLAAWAESMRQEADRPDRQKIALLLFIMIFYLNDGLMLMRLPLLTVFSVIAWLNLGKILLQKHPKLMLDK